MDPTLTRIGGRSAHGAAGSMLLVLAAILTFALLPTAAAGPPAEDELGAAPGLTVAPLAVPGSPSALPPEVRDVRLLDRLADPDEAVVVVDATGRLHARLPLTVDNVGTTVGYLAQASDEETEVVAVDLASGGRLRSGSLLGAYHLPVVARDGLPRGLSHDGSTLVLAATPAQRADGPIVTRFALIDTGFTQPPGIVELPGRFGFDAISPNATVFYLVEYLPTDRPTDYQVRAYDLAAGALLEKIVVDKVAGQPLMQGEPLVQLSSSDGRWVYTLYRNGRHGPFVHALDTVQGVAFCHFLRALGAADHTDQGHPVESTGAERAWTIALGADDQLLVAANADLGLLARIDPSHRPFVRLGRFEPVPAAGHAMPSSAAMDPAGRRLYVASGDGVLVFDVERLRLRDQLLPGRAVSSVRYDAAAFRLVAHDPERRQIVVVDPVGGQELATHSAPHGDVLLGSLP